MNVNLLLLSRTDVERLLDVDALLDGLAQAMAALSAHEVSMPPRAVTQVVKREALMSAMPVYLPGSETLAAKLVTVFPGNAEVGAETHQAVVVAFDPASGTPVAIMDGSAMTATRTAATSALATRLLAREDADVLSIIGTGVQAWAHALCCLRVRPFREVRVYGRSGEKARSLASRISETLGVDARAVGSVEEAMRNSAVICATTHAEEPVVLGRWLEPGVHVNSVGQNYLGREVDEEAVLKSLVVVELRAAALHTGPGGANDLTWPIRDGVITGAHIHAELGEIVAGQRPGRTSAEQVTLYKSVGIAVEDAVAARIVLDAARREGAGRQVTL